jgi:type I restriction enzyme S subunit
MKRYDSYKDSGVEWIGEIPISWEVKRIKHTTYVKGRIGWQGMRSDEFLELSDSYVVTGTDFENGRIKWETCYQVPIERYDEDPFIQLKDGDLLITKDGTIGKVAVVENLPKIATLNSGVFLTRPIFDSYVPKFMYWILFSDVFKTFYDFNKSGSTIQHLYQNVFNEFKFPLPSHSEQTIITNYLDQKTTQIDDLIAKKERLIKLLEEERITIINHAVTKGLDPTVHMKDSGVEWLGEIPAHWELKRMRYLCDITTGGRDTENREDDGLYPFYVRSQTVERISSYSFDGEAILTAGDGVGVCKVWHYVNEKFDFHQRVYMMCNFQQVLGKYLFYYLKENFGKEVMKLSAKSTVDSLRRPMFQNFLVCFGSIDEQKQIVLKIEKEENRIQTIIGKTQQEIELLREYKTALISEVVTGKVDVRDMI